MTEKSNKLSSYKLVKIAYLALKNAIRLHLDSIYLFKNKSFPSALQLSILAMEEIGKSKELENYYYHLTIDNSSLEGDEEEKYLKLHYFHPWKQSAAIAREPWDYSPKFLKYIVEKKLEIKKQQATYVGLKMIKGKIDFNGRIQSPFSIKENDVKSQISLINDILLEMCELRKRNEFYFDIESMNELIGDDLRSELKSKWKIRSNLKSSRWGKTWLKNT